MTDQHLDWVRESLAATGFLLEHRVYQTLNSIGLNAFLGALYRDSNTSVGRELDVMCRDSLAIAPTLTLWSSLLVEAKAWKAPVVVIGTSRKNLWQARSFSEVVTAGDPLANNEYQRIAYSNLSTFLALRSLQGSSETADFFGNQMVLLEHKKGGFSASNSGVQDSVMLPLAKAMLAEQEVLASPLPPQASVKFLSLVLSFPVLVTSGPVLEAEPIGMEVRVREVPWTRIVRRFQDKGLPDSIIIDVVQERALTAWVEARYFTFRDNVRARLAIAEPLLAGQRDGRLLSAQDAIALRRLWQASGPSVN